MSRETGAPMQRLRRAVRAKLPDGWASVWAWVKARVSRIGNGQRFVVACLTLAGLSVFLPPYEDVAARIPLSFGMLVFAVLLLAWDGPSAAERSGRQADRPHYRASKLPPPAHAVGVTAGPAAVPTLSTAHEEYRTELIAIEEQWIGKTTSASHRSHRHIAELFNRLAADGWELVNVVQIPVTGKLKRSREFRVLALAVFRRSTERRPA